MTERRLMRRLKAAYQAVWFVWDESEKMIDSSELAPDDLIEAANLVESPKLALVHAYQKLGGDIGTFDEVQPCRDS